MKLKTWMVAGSLLVGAGNAPLLWAQAFPSKPLRMILPFPPGGPTDLLGRTLGQKMAENMGHAVVIDNRPGAGGNLGVELAAKSPPVFSHVTSRRAPSLMDSSAVTSKLG